MGAGSALFMGFLLSLIGIGLTAAFLGAEQKWPALFGLVFVASGFFLLASASKRTIVFQKDGNTTVTDKRILFGAPKIQTFPTSSISRVSLESHTEYQNRSVNDTAGNFNRTVAEPVLVGTLSIVLNDGSSIAIDTASRNQSMGGGGFTFNGIPIGGIISTIKSFTGKPPLTKEAEKLAGFLGVPFNSEGSTGNIIGDIQQAFSGQSTAPQTFTGSTSQAQTPTSTISPSPTPAQPAPPTSLPPQPTAQPQNPTFPLGGQSPQTNESPVTSSPTQPPQTPPTQQF